MSLMQRHAWPIQIALLAWLFLLRAAAAGTSPVPEHEAHFASVAGSDSAIRSGLVSSIIQDATGFLWVGTAEGIVRYDGYTFRKLSMPGKGVAEEKVRFTNVVLPDRRGRLWIGTSDGLSMVDPDQERWRILASPVAQGTTPSVVALALDRDDSMWVGSRFGGVSHVDAEGRALGRYLAGEHGLPDNRIQTLLVDRRGNLWVGTWNGLVRKNRGQSEFIPVPLGDAQQTIGMLYEAPDGRIWVGSFDGDLLIIDPDGGAQQWIERGNRIEHGKRSAVTVGHTLGPDEIWLGRSNGIDVRGADGRLLHSMRYDWRKPWGMHGSGVRAILRDQSGTVWIGGYGGGLQRYVPNPGTWVRRPDPDDTGILADLDVRSIRQMRNGEIWLGTAERGVAIMDTQLRLIGKIEAGAAGQPGFSGGQVGAITQSQDGAIWIGSDVFLLEYSEQRVLRRAIPNRYGRNRALLMDSGGQLWFGTQTGLYRLPPGRDAQPIQVPELTGVNAIVEGPDHALWIGTSSGFFYLAPGSAQAERVVGLTDTNGFTPDILGLLFDQQGRLWIDTAIGLFRATLLGGHSVSFEAATPQAGRYSFGANLLDDARGRIWTQIGLFDPATRRLDHLGIADGIDIGTGWFRSYAKLRDGRMLFGGTDGVQVIDPASFTDWRFKPPVVLSELRINGMPVAAGLARTGLQLEPQQRSFSVEFAALDYTNPTQNRYRYQLQGYDEQWQERNAELRVASYTNLAPGRYTLQVQGSNRSGDWSDHQLLIPVEILPAWWQTGVARALLVLMAGLLVYTLIQWRTLLLRRRQTVLETKVRESTGILRQMDEISKELSISLDRQAICQALHRHLGAMLPLDAFGVAVLTPDAAHLELQYYGGGAASRMIRTDDADDPLAQVLRGQQVVPAPTTSTLYQRLIVNAQCSGVLVLCCQRPAVYGERERDIVGSIAAHAGIALANASAYQMAETARQQAARALEDLRQTQGQLIQSEKMAALGQLIAGVAHEINTPIGAVKASGRNITDSLSHVLDNLPRLLQLLDGDSSALFAALIGAAGATPSVLSTREERVILRQLGQQLEQAGVADPARAAAVLLQLGVSQQLERYLPLLRHPEAELIIDTAFSLGTITSSAANINLAVDRVAKIVFALKSFSRIDPSGAMVDVDLREGIETALTIYHSQIRHGVDLVRDYADIGLVHCLPDELNQVWTNLIHNALQAMNYKGTLNITLRQVGAEAVVSVKDSGCGIAPAIRDRIFTAFFTTKAAGEGTGLGLDIVKKIIDKHAGRIDVHSEQGEGATFSVHLPMAGPAPPTPTAAPSYP